MQKENLEVILNFIKWVLGFFLLVFMVYIYFFKEKFDFLFFGIPTMVMNLPIKEILSLLDAVKNAKPK